MSMRRQATSEHSGLRAKKTTDVQDASIMDRIRSQTIPKQERLKALDQLYQLYRKGLITSEFFPRLALRVYLE